MALFLFAINMAAHGKTWINRNGDERLGSSQQGRKAWENMLRDAGLQYNFISYADEPLKCPLAC
jgi:hypothetical protein